MYKAIFPKTLIFLASYLLNTMNAIFRLVFFTLIMEYALAKYSVTVFYIF